MKPTSARKALVAALLADSLLLAQVLGSRPPEDTEGGVDRYGCSGQACLSPEATQATWGAKRSIPLATGAHQSQPLNRVTPKRVDFDAATTGAGTLQPGGAQTGDNVQGAAVALQTAESDLQRGLDPAVIKRCLCVKTVDVLSKKPGCKIWNICQDEDINLGKDKKKKDIILKPNEDDELHGMCMKLVDDLEDEMEDFSQITFLHNLASRCNPQPQAAEKQVTNLQAPAEKKRKSQPAVDPYAVTYEFVFWSRYKRPKTSGYDYSFTDRWLKMDNEEHDEKYYYPPAEVRVGTLTQRKDDNSYYGKCKRLGYKILEHEIPLRKRYARVKHEIEKTLGCAENAVYLSDCDTNEEAMDAYDTGDRTSVCDDTALTCVKCP